MPDWRLSYPVRRVDAGDAWNVDFDLFTITGGIVRVISLYGHVTATAAGANATPRLRFTEALGPTASFMSAAFGAFAPAINEFITWTGLLGGLLVLSGDVGHMVCTETFGGSGLTLGPGVIDCENGGAVDGTLTIDWYLEYIPLTWGAVVAAA